MLDDVLAHAASLGLKVKFTDLGRRAGELRRSGLVLINERRSKPAQRVAIAHECGHHAHGHGWSAAHDVPRDEREADTYAARLLVSPVEYALAERMYGGHAGAIARELEVPVPLIELWRTEVLRRGNLPQRVGGLRLLA